MDSTKNRGGTCYAKHVFLHPVRSVGNIVHFGASRVQNSDALFFMLGWESDGFAKKRIRPHYDELVSLHPTGSAVHVVHSSASEGRNIDALFLCSVRTGTDSTKNMFFMLGWDRYRFDKKHTGTPYIKLVFLHLVGFPGHIVHSGAFAA
jgi:hypothetical protein